MAGVLKNHTRSTIQVDPATPLTVQENNPTTWNARSVLVGVIGSATDIGTLLTATTVAFTLENRSAAADMFLGESAAVNDTGGSADAGERLQPGAKKTIAIAEGSGPAFPLFVAHGGGAGTEDLRLSIFEAP